MLNLKVYHPDDITVKEQTQVNLQANAAREVKMYEMTAALLAVWYGDLLCKFVVDKTNLKAHQPDSKKVRYCTQMPNVYIYIKKKKKNPKQKEKSCLKIQITYI